MQSVNIQWKTPSDPRVYDYTTLGIEYDASAPVKVTLLHRPHDHEGEAEAPTPDKSLVTAKGASGLPLGGGDEVPRLSEVQIAITDVGNKCMNLAPREVLPTPGGPTRSRIGAVARGSL